MTWTESKEEGHDVIKVSGDVDLQSSPKLRGFLLSKVKTKCPVLLVDFTDVGYIDSSGLATLVEYYQGSRAFSGRLVLFGMNARVRSIFELVRLSEIFTIQDNRKDALQSV